MSTASDHYQMLQMHTQAGIHIEDKDCIIFDDLIDSEAQIITNEDVTSGNLGNAFYNNIQVLEEVFKDPESTQRRLTACNKITQYTNNLLNETERTDQMEKLKEFMIAVGNGPKELFKLFFGPIIIGNIRQKIETTSASGKKGQCFRVYLGKPNYDNVTWISKPKTKMHCYICDIELTKRATQKVQPNNMECEHIFPITEASLFYVLHLSSLVPRLNILYDDFLTVARREYAPVCSKCNKNKDSRPILMLNKKWVDNESNDPFVLNTNSINHITNKGGNGNLKKKKRLERFKKIVDQLLNAVNKSYQNSTEDESKKMSPKFLMERALANLLTRYIDKTVLKNLDIMFQAGQEINNVNYTRKKNNNIVIGMVVKINKVWKKAGEDMKAIQEKIKNRGTRGARRSSRSIGPDYEELLTNKKTLLAKMENYITQIIPPRFIRDKVINEQALRESTTDSEDLAGKSGLFSGTHFGNRTAEMFGLKTLPAPDPLAPDPLAPEPLITVLDNAVISEYAETVVPNANADVADVAVEADVADLAVKAYVAAVADEEVLAAAVADEEVLAAAVADEAHEAAVAQEVLAAAVADEAAIAAAIADFLKDVTPVADEADETATGVAQYSPTEHKMENGYTATAAAATASFPTDDKINPSFQSQSQQSIAQANAGLIEQVNPLQQQVQQANADETYHESDFSYEPIGWSPTPPQTPPPTQQPQQTTPEEDDSHSLGGGGTLPYMQNGGSFNEINTFHVSLIIRTYNYIMEIIKSLPFLYIYDYIYDTESFNYYQDKFFKNLIYLNEYSNAMNNFLSTRIYSIMYWYHKTEEDAVPSAAADAVAAAADAVAAAAAADADADAAADADAKVDLKEYLEMSDDIYQRTIMGEGNYPISDNIHHINNTYINLIINIINYDSVNSHNKLMKYYESIIDLNNEHDYNKRDSRYKKDIGDVHKMTSVSEEAESKMTSVSEEAESIITKPVTASAAAGRTFGQLSDHSTRSESKKTVEQQRATPLDLDFSKAGIEERVRQYDNFLEATKVLITGNAQNLTIPSWDEVQSRKHTTKSSKKKSGTVGKQRTTPTRTEVKSRKHTKKSSKTKSSEKKSRTVGKQRTTPTWTKEELEQLSRKLEIADLKRKGEENEQSERERKRKRRRIRGGKLKTKKYKRKHNSNKKRKKNKKKKTIKKKKKKKTIKKKKKNKQ